MLEAIEYYQSLAEKFDSRILFVPGIAVVLVGLCIWLAGLRWQKVLGALAGGGFFAATIFSFGDFQFHVVLALVFIGVILGALFEKIMLGIFGTALTVIIVLVITSSIAKQKQYKNAEHLDSIKETTEQYLLSQKYCPRWPQYEQNGVVINFPQSVEITSKVGSYIVAKTIENIKTSSPITFAAAGAVFISCAFFAFIMPRIFIALTSSSLGSAVIFAGMIMLLFYKGSKPVDSISNQSHFYSMLILIMLVFGALVQLILSPCPAKTSTQKPADENKGGDK